MKHTAALALMVFALTAPLALTAPAMAQEPSTSVDGFRTAKFGMDEVAVKAAIGEDFGLPESQIIRSVHPTEKTAILSVRITDLLPDTGTAQVNYVFGFQSHKLNQVNVQWLEANEPSLGQAAMTLRDYFRALPLVPEKTVIDGRMPDGNVLAFRGVDRQGRMVLEVFQPVKKDTPPAEAAGEKPPAKKGKPGKTSDKPAASAGTDTSDHDRLSLIYLETPGNPDVFRLKPGQF